MLLSALRRVADVFVPGSPSIALADHGAANDLETRSAPRHEAEIAATICLLGREFECTIRNLSPRGMTIAVDGISPCVGMQVLVMGERLPTCCGTVRWFRDGQIGVELVNPLSLDQIYDVRHATSSSMQPRAGRGRMKLPAFARFGDQVRKVEVHNLSVGGLMMSSGLLPKPGQPMMIEFADMLPIGSHVRWTANGSCGVMFSKLLPLSSAEELASRGGLPAGWLDEVRLLHERATAH